MDNYLLFVSALLASVINVNTVYGNRWTDHECESEYSIGPHSIACLNRLWIEAGCFLSGQGAPSTAGRYGNGRTVNMVQHDMELVYEYAMNGDETHQLKCFGDDIACSYQKFEGYALYGLNDESISQATPKSCSDKCTKMGARCKSFDYNTHIKSCLLSSANREAAPDSYGTHEHMVYYEKVCGNNVPMLWTDDDENDGTVPGVIVHQDGHCYSKYGPLGGGGGGRWNDKDSYQLQNITRIAIRYADYINTIQITYGQHTGPSHGGSGGARFEMALEDGEYVTGVSGKERYYWYQIGFTTNKRSVGPFGTNYGDAFRIDSGGKSLAYISGGSGIYIDRMTFYFNC